jgi:hypothetical protein
MTRSAIEWTETTWNPLTGCDKVSPGCKNCYAEPRARRLKAMGQQRYANGFDLTLHEPLLEQPLHWRKPQTIFVNSMSDLFHEGVAGSSQAKPGPTTEERIRALEEQVERERQVAVEAAAYLPTTPARSPGRPAPPAASPPAQRPPHRPAAGGSVLGTAGRGRHGPG